VAVGVYEIIHAANLLFSFQEALNIQKNVLVSGKKLK